MKIVFILWYYTIDGHYTVGMGRMFEAVCLSAALPNLKTNDPKVFKLGLGNDLEISKKWHDFLVERLKVKVGVQLQQFGVGLNSMNAF